MLSRDVSKRSSGQSMDSMTNEMEMFSGRSRLASWARVWKMRWGCEFQGLGLPLARRRLLEAVRREGSEPMMRRWPK
eukprot:938042-Heterocapsa_arctica.AAC.1